MRDQKILENLEISDKTLKFSLNLLNENSFDFSEELIEQLIAQICIAGIHIKTSIELLKNHGNSNRNI